MNKHRISLYEVSEHLDDERVLYFCQFLDDFYAAPTDEERSRLLFTEPLYRSEHREYLCMLAAAAETLSHRYNLPVPEWTTKEEYFMPELCYAFHTKNVDYQELLKDTTLDEYKRRNLLYGERVLMRC